MSVDASYTTTRFPRWSSTGNAAARPDAWPALHLSSRGAPKSSLSTAHSNLPIQHPLLQNPRALCSLRCCGIFSAGVVKLNNCRGISGRDRRLDEPRIFAQPATLPGAKNVNLTKPAGRFGSPTGRSDSRPQATPSRTETEALSGFMALDHTTFRDALKMFGRRFG